MAYSYVWPATLPQSVQKGYSETGGVNIVRTSPDLGPAKQRYRGKSSQQLNVSFLMTSAQVAILNTFIETTIKGTARFGFTHPRTNQIVEVRISPQQNSQFYTSTYAAPGYYTVQMQLEVLP